MNTIQSEHLTAEIAAWCKQQGLEWASADEMLHDETLSQYQRQWLAEFCNRWEFAEDGEMHFMEYLIHPNAYGEQTIWLTSPEYRAFVADWGTPFIPEGYEPIAQE